MKSRRIIISFIVISMICVSSFLLCADTDWKEDLEKDYKKVLESKKAKNHRSLVLKWHSQGHLAWREGQQCSSNRITQNCGKT